MTQIISLNLPIIAESILFSYRKATHSYLFISKGYCYGFVGWDYIS